MFGLQGRHLAGKEFLLAPEQRVLDVFLGCEFSNSQTFKKLLA